MSPLLLLLACRAETPVTPAAPAPAAEVVLPAAVPPIVITLEPPRPDDRFRYEAEASGMVTLLIEAALGELGGVLVVVGDLPAPAGSSRPVGMKRAERWTGRVALGTDPHALDVELELCAPGGRSCRSTSATASRDAPERAIPALMAFAGEILGRQPNAGAAGQWTLPVSADPYAVLVGGRAAATWYGLMPAVDEAHEGDRNRDPVQRAVYIDPSMALAQWIIGRRHAVRGRWDDALPAFTAAREGRPFMPVLLADEATAMAEQDHLSASSDAWDGLLLLVPDDARFSLRQADAALRAKRLEAARPLLETLSGMWPEDAGVAESRVALADAAGEETGTDELLAHWQATDPSATGPVRRRIHLRVRGGAYREAWDMIPELRARGAEGEATLLEVSIGVATGEWEAAAAAAERLSRADMATRIRTRAALEGDAEARADALEDDPSAEARVVLGRQALAEGRPDVALTRATEAERAWPWHPDALALSRDAYSALGRTADAARAEARLAAIEPAPPAVLVPVGR